MKVRAYGFRSAGIARQMDNLKLRQLHWMMIVALFLVVAVCLFAAFRAGEGRDAVKGFPGRDPAVGYPGSEAIYSTYVTGKLSTDPAPIRMLSSDPAPIPPRSEPVPHLSGSEPAPLPQVFTEAKPVKKPVMEDVDFWREQTRIYQKKSAHWFSEYKDALDNQNTQFERGLGEGLAIARVKKELDAKDSPEKDSDLAATTSAVEVPLPHE